MRSTGYIIQALCIYSCFITVRCDFKLLVNLVNYTNPTGLCAECLRPLNTSNLEGTAPVCCEEQPYTSDNCNNTGDARCDTRFRWTIRPFGAPLETRSGMGFDGFTDCKLSPSTCPFSEMSTTFSQGERRILGVTDNPIIIYSTFQTVDQLQFYIEPVDSGLPYIIDSLLVNLDNLQLGGDFTEEMMFTGFHNISTMTMSFRVECSPGFCGLDCTTTPTNNPLVAQCYPNGSVICVDSKRDPLAYILCSDCLYNLDIATNCSTCLEANYDPDTNCQACLPNYDATNNCQSCTNIRFNPLDGGCTPCLTRLYDPQTNCTQCLPNGDIATNCTQCLPNYDITTQCTTCMSGYNISISCTTCLTGFKHTSAGCVIQCESGQNSSCDNGTESGTSGVGGIVGGVVGVQFIVILIIMVVIMVLCIRRKKNKKTTKKPDNEQDTDRVSSTSDNGVIELQSNPVYNVHTHPSAAACDSDQEIPITMEQNPVYQVANVLSGTVSNVEGRGGGNTDTDLTADYYENTGLGPTHPQDYDYVQV